MSIGAARSGRPAARRLKGHNLLAPHNFQNWPRVRFLLPALLIASLLPACESARPASPELVAAARDSVALPVRTLDAETRMVAWFDSVLASVNGDAEALAELELLRLRAIERVLTLPALEGYNPFANAAVRVEPPPGVADWVTAHEDHIEYSEPAGDWLVPAGVFWELHEKYDDTAFADEIAWAAANGGLAGECEGMPGCYVDSLLQTFLRYLEMHPAGKHVEAALDRVSEELIGLVQLETSRPLCGDELTSEGVRPEQLARIREVLATVPSVTTETMDALAAAERRCGIRDKQSVSD